MKKVLSMLATCVTVASAATAAHASVEIDAFNEELKKEYDGYLKDLNENAGLTGGKEIKGGYVVKTFPAAAYSNGGSYGLTPYVRTSCTSGVSAVRDLVVAKEVYKNAIVKKLRRIDCAYGGKDKSAFKLTLKKGVLTVVISEEVYGAEVYEKATDFVKKSL